MSDRTMFDVSDIEVDDALQPRLDGLDKKHVAELQETGPDAWPPIVVVEQSGRYVLVDGRHRFEAARMGDQTKIAVDVQPIPADGDCIDRRHRYHTFTDMGNTFGHEAKEMRHALERAIRDVRT